MEDTPDLLPARMVNEFAYCPRLFYLEWVQQEFRDSADTVSGRMQHRRVDKEQGDVPGSAAPAAGPGPGSPAGLPAPGVAADGAADADAGGEASQIHATSVLLSSPERGLIARIDLVEGQGRCVSPVDYKRGQVPDNPERSWEEDRVQLCAQALILRDNGYSCNEGVLYYVESRTRVSIAITDDLVQHTEELVQTARAVARAEQAPAPLIDSPKCPRCSLAGICLPDELHLLRALQEEPTQHAAPACSGSGQGGPPGSEQAELSGPGVGSSAADAVRRLFPARDDAVPVYVQEQGALVGKAGERLVVKVRDKVVSDVRLIDVAQLSVWGGVQVSTPLLRELAAQETPICYFSSGGWFSAITTGIPHKNIDLRRRQFAVAADAAASLRIARDFVRGKILNARTLLRRNHSGSPVKPLEQMARYAAQAKQADTADSLLGIEGMAANVYFGEFPGMLKPQSGDVAVFDFTSRNRRPPKDPVNALLSYAYSLLVKDLTITLLAVGFDPYLGFYHRPRYGRPALALDLMEEFRPLVGDSVVLSLINNGEIQGKDFVVRAGAVSLTPGGRKKFLAAYERRMQTLIRHPVFGYTISYRRVLEVQARLLARYLMGEIQQYPPFLTR
ncbi:MAG: CRISPR-associated endonuclease Cas1 [Firmicutes bacterium]|nr:CRISPR-associated endonuclease Cas1 [Bacillota bacterium]